MRYREVTQQIIGAAFEVHNHLGAGFLERIYERALAFELKALGLHVERQHPVPVHYKGIQIGDYYADLFISGVVICEIKAVETLSSKHETQLVNYLAASHQETGLLVNFGSSVIVKRKFLKYQRKK